MKDPEGILIKQSENVQASHQIRFTGPREIVEKEPILEAYIREAIEVEQSGAKVEFKKTEDFTIPEEFHRKLDATPGLKTAFDALTPGRRRAYLLYFSAPKQARTRESRIEKCAPLILRGKGLND